MSSVPGMALPSGGEGVPSAPEALLALEVRSSEQLPLELMITVALRVLVLFVVIGAHTTQLGFKLVSDVANDSLELLILLPHSPHPTPL